MSSFFLGLDTSCYTTSLAVLDKNGQLICDWRRMLQVKGGEKGLRQSEAFFQHVKNIPLFFTEAAPKQMLHRVLGIAASTRPRPKEGSYMPVFLAGESAGRSMAAGTGALFSASTHQEGHIMAGLWDSSLDWEEFWAFHVSGGTTEVAKVYKNKTGFMVETAGGGQDLSAGQFIDRIGVRLGLLFPAGKDLEELARQASGTITLPVAQQHNQISFSGPESHAQRLLDQGAFPVEVARSVEVCIARSLAGLARYVIGPGGEKILFVGGVMANGWIKTYLQQHLQDHQLVFSSPRLSGDNAVGLAEIARQQWHCQ